MHTELLALIARTAPLNPADAAECIQCFRPLTLKKNTVVVATGQVPSHLYFIRAGCMRLFYATEQGEEATTHLGFPSDFMTPFLGFVQQQPAAESLATVTGCDVLGAAHADLAALIERSAAFKAFSLLIFEQALTAGAQRANSLATLGAAQRYGQLLARHPAVLLHVPVGQVASFLGIRPESLSRIRRQANS